MREQTLTDGERQHLTRLVVQHQGRLRAFLCRFETDPAELDELLQDIFIGVVPRIEELAGRPEDEAAKYLRGIARNLVRLRWRKARKHKTERIDPVRDLLQSRMEEELDVESPGRLDLLKLCMKELSKRARQLVTLRFFRGVPATEIAKDLNESDAAVRMNMMRIRKKLRVCMEHRVREA